MQVAHHAWNKLLIPQTRFITIISFNCDINANARFDLHRLIIDIINNYQGTMEIDQLNICKHIRPASERGLKSTYVIYCYNLKLVTIQTFIETKNNTTYNMSPCNLVTKFLTYLVIYFLVELKIMFYVGYVARLKCSL